MSSIPMITISERVNIKYSSLYDAIIELDCIKTKLEALGVNISETSLSIDTSNEYPYVFISYKRPMTTEEFNEAEKQKEKMLNFRKQQYENLKKEFEGK
jgi:hypothetical protein